MLLQKHSPHESQFKVRKYIAFVLYVIYLKNSSIILNLRIPLSLEHLPLAINDKYYSTINISSIVETYWTVQSFPHDLPITFAKKFRLKYSLPKYVTYALQTQRDS